jgi:ribosomal RNA-processing protein 9
VSGLSFRQNTHQLYSSSFDRSVKLWSVDEMTYIETLFVFLSLFFFLFKTSFIFCSTLRYGHQDKILSIDSLNKERCVTCGARDRSIRVWKIIEESQLIFQGTNL